MDILKLMYLLGKELGFILGVVSLCIGIHTWLNPGDGTKSAKRKGISIVCFLIILVLVANYFYMGNYVLAPDATGLTYRFAQFYLRTADLQVVPLGESAQSIHEDSTVIQQSVIPGTVIPKNATILLTLSSPQTSTQDVPLLPPEITVNDVNTPENDISIIIDSYEFFDDGFYYSEPEPDDPNTSWFIEYDKGISGQFHYSRDLTEEELRSWAHGGSLYYVADGQKVDLFNEGYAFSLWSDADGYFALEFSENLPAGTYIYEFFNVIGGQYVYAELEFQL